MSLSPTEILVATAYQATAISNTESAAACPFGNMRTLLVLRTSPCQSDEAEEAPSDVHRICAYLTASTPFIQLYVSYPLGSANPDE